MSNNKDPLAVVSLITGRLCRFASQMNRFAATRPNRGQPFFIGQWLQSLPDADLDALRETVESEDLESAEGGNPQADEWVMLTMTAYRRELAPRTFKKPDEEKFRAMMEAVRLAVAHEDLQRRNFIVLESPFSVLPHRKLKMRLTDYAIETLGLDGTEESKEQALAMLQAVGAKT